MLHLFLLHHSIERDSATINDYIYTVRLLASDFILL